MSKVQNEVDLIVIASLLNMSGILEEVDSVNENTILNQLAKPDFRALVQSTFLKKNKTLDEINGILSVETNIVTITRLVNASKVYAIKLY